MDLNQTIEAFAVTGLAIALVISYLKVNKVWGRRHIKEVAESISVVAASLGLLTALPFVVKFAVLNGDPVAAGRFLLSALVAAVFFLVGIGLWVRAGEENFWRRVRRAVRLERDELGTLLHSLTRPREARAIIKILSLMSRVDQQLDDSEMRLMLSVARPWGIHESEFSAPPGQEQVDIFSVRDAFLAYMAMSPPREQVKKVADLVRFMAEADQRISREERLVLDELEPAVHAYLRDRELEMESHEVLVVPQNPEQFRQVREQIGPLALLKRAGGEAFVVGSYFSRPFAMEVCRRYRRIGFFTTVEKVDDQDSQHTTIAGPAPRLPDPAPPDPGERAPRDPRR